MRPLSPFQVRVLRAIRDATDATPRFRRRGMTYAEIREASGVPARQGFLTTLGALVRAGELTTDPASWEQRKWKVSR